VLALMLLPPAAARDPSGDRGSVNLAMDRPSRGRRHGCRVADTGRDALDEWIVIGRELARSLTQTDSDGEECAE
jgi:hypothetical protein